MMDVNSWHFAQWFTFAVISLAIMFVMVYGLSFLILNREEIREYRAGIKENRQKEANRWKESGICPEWADERRFQATRLEEEE